jgi:hypothetical protein
MATITIDERKVPATQYVTPSTGGTVNVDATGNVILLLNPSGTLATLTVNFPSNPTDGDIVTIATSQIITALTVGNGTIIGTLTTLILGGFARFIYNSTANKWFRIG